MMGTKKRIFFLILALFVFALPLYSALAEFRIPYSVFSERGGRGESTNYRIYETLGQAVVGISSGSNNEIRTGYLNLALGFIVDIVAPELFIGILAGTVTPDYLSIYLSSNEVLEGDATGTFKLTKTSGDSAVTSETLAKLPDHDAMYYTKYKLTDSGTLEIRVSANDQSGNTGYVVRTYTTASVNPLEPFTITSQGGYIEIKGGKGAVMSNGYILFGRVSEQVDVTGRPVNLSEPKTATGKDPMTPIGEILHVMGTVSLMENCTIRVKYDADEIAPLTSDDEYDERKIGLYRYVNGNWEYAGGEGQGSQVKAKFNCFGTYAVLYNPGHQVLPKALELSQNYPNPFNPTTTIKFALPVESSVNLAVYNVLGQRVRVLMNQPVPAGYHSVTWNGTNESGDQVASGLYVYRLETSEGIKTKKMLLLK